MNKNLLALSVAVAALASSASAAVSSNIVGYVKLNLKKGLTLISNPLNNTASNGNNISNLFAGVGDADVYTWDGSAFVTSSFLNGVGLVTPDFAVPPGVSLFIEVPADVSVTMVGEALTGTQTKAIQAGNNFVASKIPISGLVETDLGITPSDGDTVLKWENGGYVAYDYAAGIGWPNSQPTLAVGQGMVYQTTKPFTWTKTFTVN